VPTFRKPIYNKDLFALQSNIIKQIAGQCSSVIVGRGGFYILKDKPDTIHVFIHAPFDYRVEHIMKEQKMDEKDARAMVQESDRTRTKFIRDMLGIDWTDARNFHLSIDTSIISLSAVVEIITNMVGNKAFNFKTALLTVTLFAFSIFLLHLCRIFSFLLTVILNRQSQQKCNISIVEPPPAGAGDCKSRDSIGMLKLSLSIYSNSSKTI